MLINDVESIVGMSKKSIRYYEENGLISPNRDSNNKYRTYTEKDILELKKIKLLRELGVSIKDIKAIQSNEYSLRECMSDRITKINQDMKQYDKAKSICESIYFDNESFQTIGIDQYFQMMNVLNKEGFSMRNIKEEHTKKIKGAIYSSFLFCSFFVIMIIIMIYAQSVDPIPIGLWISICAIFVIPILMIPFTLYTRIQEIKGGEEDEASKY